MDRKVPILFENKKDCCSCGACLNICPRQAISMQEDECGFLYPRINEEQCIHCGKCKKVCFFQNEFERLNDNLTYAAVARDVALLEKSASGGVFAVVAKKIIENGGVVFGAEMTNDYFIQHTCVGEICEISKLQGSKYSQSNTKKTYSEVKYFLQQGRQVLYSGTPCQIAGLYGFLGQEVDGLVTIDIVCHGVPNNRMFQEYIATLGDDVKHFSFRDKSTGWGKNGSAEIDGKCRKIWESSSSYLYYFSKGWICRESCYQCPYASKQRIGDITLGDYWGIEKQHPEYLGKNGFNESRGLSVVIVNTEKGKNLIDSTREQLEIKLSSIEKAAVGNPQLREPSKPGKRDELLRVYEDGGWKEIERLFRKNIGWRYYSSQVKCILPNKVKKLLKAMR